MHSSRMRTGRSLTVFRSLQPEGGCTWSGGGTWSGGVYFVPGGVPGPRGVPGPGGVPGRGVPGSRGGVPDQVLPPPVNRMTNRCKNITLAKTSFRPVIISENLAIA